MGVDVGQGASQIAQLLQQSEPSNSESEQPEMVEDTVEETESEHHEPETVEDDEEETQEAEAESDTESEPLYTVKVNGEELEVGIDDLKKSYMMESDYRKKTSEVAKQRESVKTKEDEFTKKLADAETLLRADIEDLNSEENLELKDIDPEAYYKKREKLEVRARKFQEMQQDAVKIRQERDAERVSQESELLMSAMPSWIDESVKDKEIKLINDFWDKTGYTQDDRNKATHKDILIARKAALYDQLQAAKPETKKLKTKPKSAKPGTVTSKEERSRKSTQTQRERLRKTGNVRDGAKAIKALIKGD